MISGSFPPPSQTRRLAVVGWTDLPPELLPDIAGNIQNPIDIIRFRSVCRTWRFSVPPPPPNKISFLFPLKVSLTLCFKWYCNCKSLNKYVIAIAVYLLRPHREGGRDPSKSWIVSVQESNAGKLILRHPITNKRISSPGKSIDLSELRVNRIAISYRFRRHTTKVVFVSNSDGSNAMAVYPYPYNLEMYTLRAVRFGLSDPSKYDGEVIIRDFVKFNERVYVVDTKANVYVIDSTKMKLLPILDCARFPYAVRAQRSWKRFVVSDGDLYIVMELCLRSCDWPECRVFKLAMDGIGNATSYNPLKVLSLGGRVFFISHDSSFSVHARDLPRPLQGNCIIFNSNEVRACRCPRNCQKSDIYHLGGETQEMGLMSSAYVKSALFDHPPFVVD